MVRDLFPDADLLARSGPMQFAVLTLAPVKDPEPLMERISGWVRQRTGRASAVPVLEFDAAEVLVNGGERHLSELLRFPMRQAAAMQK
jgi:hypothetical protein